MDKVYWYPKKIAVIVKKQNVLKNIAIVLLEVHNAILNVNALIAWIKMLEKFKYLF